MQYQKSGTNRSQKDSSVLLLSNFAAFYLKVTNKKNAINENEYMYLRGKKIFMML